VLADVVKLVRSHATLLAPVPAAMAELLGLRPREVLYASLSGGAVVYSRSPGGVPARVYAMRKYVTRAGETRYYFAVTVPKPIAEQLGLGKGSKVLLVATGSELRLAPIQ